MLLHIRQNRRQAKINVSVHREKHWAYSDSEGKYPPDEWYVDVYTGLEDFAPKFQQMRCKGNSSQFEVRPVGSTKDDWEYVYLRWNENGWYLTSDPWNAKY